MVTGFGFPLDSSDVGGPFEIPVPVLEFIGIAFGPGAVKTKAAAPPTPADQDLRRA